MVVVVVMVVLGDGDDGDSLGERDAGDGEDSPLLGKPSLICPKEKAVAAAAAIKLSCSLEKKDPSDVVGDWLRLEDGDGDSAVDPRHKGFGRWVESCGDAGIRVRASSAL